MRLIDADVIIKALDEALDDAREDGADIMEVLKMELFKNFFKQIISYTPTIEAEPIKHGHWILDKRGNYACEFCGNTPYHSNMYNMNYCPNCGAKLTIERNNISTHLIWNEPTNDQ